MQPKFINPDFIDNNSAEEIHARMMLALPSDIDNMPGGFPYDFTKPAALEKDEFINYHLVRALMLAFPQYAWDQWLDLHGQQVNVIRHPSQYASGHLTITGVPETEIIAGTIFCTPATDSTPAIEFSVDKDSVIGEDGTCVLAVTAVESGVRSNVAANTVCIMARPNKTIASVVNEAPITGGTERENNDDYYDRIAIEYLNSRTFLGNDSDYIRWAKAAGAGDCIVIPTAEGPGTVKLVLVDANGQPANDKLIEEVYEYIVSPKDRTKRLLPTACAKLDCVAAIAFPISYTCTGLLLNETTDIEQVKEDFRQAVRKVYDEAKKESLLRYNDIRPLLSSIVGVEDFDMFLINGDMVNIKFEREEYPETGDLQFSEGNV